MKETSAFQGPTVNLTVLLLTIISFNPINTLAQQEDIHFERITQEDGLSTATVTSILQDSQGFMWFGALPGLNKYDGRNIITYNSDPENPKSLSDGKVSFLFEDRQKIIWIGTRGGGLNRYDKETDTFTNYQHNSNDTTSISNNNVRVIFEDLSGSLWIGTDVGGLNKMDKESGTFLHYMNDSDNPKSLPDNKVYAISEDRFGNFWVGTFGGLSKFNRNTGQFVNYKNNPNNPRSLSSNKVFAINEDKLEAVLWVGTEMGINKFEIENGAFAIYKFNDNNLSQNRIYKLYEDAFGNLWAGIWGQGLSIFNKKTGTYKLFKHDPKDLNTLGEGSVTSIYEDQSNILWAGTTLGGVSIHKPSYSNFVLHENISSTGLTYIASLEESSQGGIWVAGGNEVIHISNEWKTTHYSSFKKGSKAYAPGVIFDLLEDSDQELWLASEGGIYKFDSDSKTFYQETIIINGEPLSLDHSYTLFEDKDKTVWAGTSAGLLQFDKRITKYTLFAHDPDNPNSLASNHINSINEDRSGVLWVGTKNGLNKFNDETNDFIRYQHHPSDPSSLSNNFILCVFRDQSGSLWSGTDYGLNLLNEKSGTFRRFTTKDGLSNNVIFGITEDNHQNIWMSTLNSISKFNIVTETFKNYKTNGMYIDEFYERSYLRTDTGKMYFGGTNGMVSFHPDNIRDNTHIPQIAFTDFKVFNESATVQKDAISDNEKFHLEKAINFTDTITLSYQHNIFSIEFAALDFVSPGENQYAYKMEGFNKEWIYTDASNRTATYTNLDPDTYTFRVKGSNNDGLWNEEGTSLVVVIIPPWWKTTLAYSGYGIAFLVGLFGFVQWRASKLEREKKVLKKLVARKTRDLSDKNDQLEEQTQQLDTKNSQLEEQAEELKAMDESKSRFFANISHEFRTPLTLINGLINRFLAKSDIEVQQRQDYSVIKRNSNRLLQLINQLLDLSKLESGALALSVIKQDIVKEGYLIALLFESAALQKNISFTLNGRLLKNHHQEKPIEAYFDKNKFNKILTNLLSNAIKFTPSRGSVSMIIEKEIDRHDCPSRMVQITVTNTGEGIPSDKLPYIFDRFYQVQSSHTRQYEGTGIGLSLVKELVELHQGKVEALSADGETVFTVSLPLGDELQSFRGEAVALEDEIDTIGQVTLSGNESNSPPTEDNKAHQSTQETEALQILIVEDYGDLIKFIGESLPDEYEIIEAANGQEGLEKAKELIPDLIISDVMMPEMDGYELCERVKSGETTDHIPVILLTAKAEQEDKLEGLEKGADDYLVKPFDGQELNTRVKNLMAIRQKLQEKYSREISLQPKKVKAASLQEQFLGDIKMVIENHMSDGELDLGQLEREIGMSRSQIHRKLKALTNQSTTEFVRNYRLYRAADLLNQEAGNISEIAYQTGFSSLAYFTKSFKKLFDCLPSEYKKD